MTLLTPHCPSPERIRRDIADKGFAWYPGAIALEAIESMRRFWIPYFRNAGTQRRKALRGNLRLGEENFNSYTDNAEWCLYRDFDFLWNKPPHPPTRELGVAIHRQRNVAQGFDETYGLAYSEDCYGIYISTSFYPPGTGRLRSHSDGHGVVPLLQYMAPFTFKGGDYDEGGLYITTPAGEVVDVDAHVQPGTIIFFDGRVKHGVATIGANSPVGRLATFAVPTFFRKQEDLPSPLRMLEKVYFGAKRRLVKDGAAY